MLWDPNLDADYYKIYPTAVTPFTKIEEWYRYSVYLHYWYKSTNTDDARPNRRQGRYRPYAEDDDGAALVELLVWFKEHVQERMLTYAGVCWRMLVYAGVCWRMLAYAGVCWRMLTYADVCWRMLTYADVC